MTDTVNEIGLAIVGCGTIGRIRAKYAREYPGVKWLGLADINEPLGRKLADDTKAEFFTTSAEELIKRPEVNAVMIITEENNIPSRRCWRSNRATNCLSKSRWPPRPVNPSRFSTPSPVKAWMPASATPSVFAAVSSPSRNASKPARSATCTRS